MFVRTIIRTIREAEDAAQRRKADQANGIRRWYECGAEDTPALVAAAVLRVTLKRKGSRNGIPAGNRLRALGERIAFRVGRPLFPL